MTFYKRYQSKKMQTHLLLMLMTICGLILFVIGYLAIMTLNQQQGLAKIQSEALAQSRIDVMQNLIFDTLAKKQANFRLRLETEALTDTSLKTWIETDPNISDIFVMHLKADVKLDETPLTQNQIQFPAPESNQESQAWLKTLGPILEDPSRLFQYAVKEGEALPTEGWYASNYDGQPILIYWVIQAKKANSKQTGLTSTQSYGTQKTAGNVLIGIKLSYVKLIADLLATIEINYAPDSIEIMQAGRTLFHAKPIFTETKAEITLPYELFTSVLPYPLHDWQINYKMAKTTDHGIFWVAVLVVGGICLMILLLTIIIYRELSKQHKAASLRVNFVGQVSHELKTPLTNIALYAQMQKEQLEEHDLGIDDAYKLPNALHQYNDVILQESQRLSRLIQNVLDFTQAPNVKLTEVPAVDIVTTLSALFQPVLSVKGIQLNVECSENLRVLTDADKVIQILCNLLSNVEKYASNGKQVDVIVSQSRSEVIFEVRDYGPGVDESSLAKLCDPFYRANTEITEGVSGTGIGLTIAKQLALSLSGKLVASQRDPGLAVTLTLPKASD